MGRKVADIVREALKEKRNPAMRKTRIQASRLGRRKVPLTAREKEVAHQGNRRGAEEAVASNQEIELFAMAYVREGFHSQRAVLSIKPHLKKSSAGPMASRLKQHPRFAEALYQEMLRVRRRLEADTNGIIRAWERQSKANLMDYFECVEDAEVGHRLRLKNLDDLPKEVQCNIRKVRVRTTSRVVDGETIRQQSVELVLVDSQAALRDLARSSGMFRDEELEERGLSVADLLRKRISALPTPVRNRLPVTFDEDGNIRE